MTILWVVAALAVGFVVGWVTRHPPEAATLPEPPSADRPWLPRDTLVELIDPESWIRANRDVDRVHALAVSIDAYGIRNPVVLVVDDRGRVVLKDGHHRLVASLRLGVPGLPVEVVPSERIRGHSYALRPLLEAALQVQAPLPERPTPPDEEPGGVAA